MIRNIKQLPDNNYEQNLGWIKSFCNFVCTRPHIYIYIYSLKVCNISHSGNFSIYIVKNKEKKTCECQDMSKKMLPLLVFCYILYKCLTSFILSVLLPLRWGLSRLFSFIAISIYTDNNNGEDAVFLYEGTVSHERRHPVPHSFKLSVRYALIDLDRSSYLPPNHLSAEEARSVAGTNGPV